MMSIGDSCTDEPVAATGLPKLASFLPVVLAFIVFAYHYRWNSDDAFVSFRVVGNLLAGYGPNYNVGERVEAFTNPLWVLVLTLLSAVFGVEQIERIAVYVGILLAALGILLSMFHSARLFPATNEHGQLFLPLMSLIVVGIRAFQEYASSGLETGLSFFLLGWVLYKLFDPEPKGFASTALLISLLPLDRPDYAIYAAIFAPYLLYRAYASRAARMWTLPLLLMLVPAAYQVFRIGYFGLLVPNTALAKEASMSYWAHGLFYLQNFLVTYRLQYLLPVYFCLAIYLAVKVPSRAFRHALALVWLASMLHATYITRVGGDFMHARMLLADFFVLVAPLAVVPISLGQMPRWVVGGICAGALAWSVVSAWTWQLDYVGPGPEFVNNEHSIWRRADSKEYINYIDVKPGSEPKPNAGRYHIHGNAGIEAFRFTKYKMYEVIFLEYCGLGSPVISHALLEERHLIGHEKCVMPLRLNWAAAQYRDLYSQSPVTLEDLEFTRDIMNHTVVGEYLKAISGPLTWGGFFSNLVNARRYTAFRLPPLDWFRDVPAGHERDYDVFDQMMMLGKRYQDVMGDGG